MTRLLHVIPFEYLRYALANSRLASRMKPPPEMHLLSGDPWSALLRRCKAITPQFLEGGIPVGAAAAGAEAAGGIPADDAATKGAFL